MGNTWRITAQNSSVAAISDLGTERRHCATSFLLLRRHYSPMRTFSSVMDFSQSALFLGLFFQFLIMHLLISVCTQFHRLFFSRPLSRLPWGLLLNTLLTFLLLSILLTWPIQFNRLTLTNESISKSPNSWINSLLYSFLQFSFTLIPPKHSS